MSITLYNGDCLEVMKKLPNKSVDLFLCDLPFGCLGDQKKGGGIPRPNTEGAFGGCPWDIKIDLKEFWRQVKRLRKNDHTPILHFCTTAFGNDLINSKPNWFRYDLVWNKDRGTSFLLVNKMPMKSHEMIYVFAKEGAYYNRIDEQGDFGAGWTSFNHNSTMRIVPVNGGRNIAKGNDGTTRCVKSVITMRKPNTLGHPTEKPLDLYKWLIERYCPAGGTVLDPTAGSCNSCFAAWELNRHAIGIEKDKKFYEKACKRVDALVDKE